MRIKRFSIILIILSLIFMNLLALAENTEKQASYFQSNGNLINGWYWLRDANLKHYAQWTFKNISPSSEDLVLNITALATDRSNGSRGCEAKFKLIYGFPGSGNMGGVFKTKVVTLPNVSSPDDPLGYTCQGQVTVDRAFIPGASTIVFRVERDSAQDNHVAFKEDSITLTIEEPEEEQPLEENQLPETNTWEGATLIQPGNYTGSLGDKDQEGHRDNDDYYQINLEEGQIITLQLTVPENAVFSLSLLNPNHSSRGSSTTQGNVKTLDYVASSSGSWYIKISRSSGEGEYQLSIDVEDQNDAESGQDAGDCYQEAIPVSPGTFTGLLKAGDNTDYYSIEVVKGQIITLQLTVPENAVFSLSLLNPNHSSRGSSTTQGNVKTLDYVASSSGSWYIKISRSSGEGEYQLSIDVEDQNDAESGQDAGDSYQEAIPVSPGTFTGLLKAGDNTDYYSISLQKGQQISLELTIPGNASYGITLLNPNHNSRGSSTTQGNVKTLDYVANSSGSWYIKISRSSGEGEYQLSIDVEKNDTESACNFTLSSYETHAEFSGGDYNIYITASSPDCEWIAEIDVPWIQISAGSSNSGTGSGTLEYKVLENGGQTRTGHITIGDQIHTVIQNARPCAIELSNYSSDFWPTGGAGEFTVTPSCSDYQWTAVSDVAWIQINSGGSGPGSQTLRFSVQNNTGNQERIGHITIEDKNHKITQKPELKLSISNEGRTLISNLPIFVNENEKGSEIDIDGDGVLQEFENQAMDLINPKFELDEDEDWFEHPEHHVVNFVRVFPYSKGDKQYIIFTYAVTWSRDYGRAGIAGHNGDVERVIMAYEVTSEGGKNLQLRNVFTSAHGGENDHSAVWNAWNRDCFTCGISAWPRDEEMCGKLVFENNILKLQISEDKHAIYPTKDCCEDVHLVYVGGGFVMEDCGGGNTWRFNCYNAGEPEPQYYLIDDLDNPSSWRELSEEKRTSLTNLFSQEQVWSGNKSHPDKFCGGLGGEGSTSDLWMDSPGTIGNKLQNLPNSLTDKL